MAAINYPKTQQEIDDFCKKNVKLIHAVLRPYKGLEDYEDLYQEAFIGFYKGVISFNPNAGTKITTYACECAKNELKMFFRKKTAKARTATVVPLDLGQDPEGESDSLLNRDLSEWDTLHQLTANLEDSVAHHEIYIMAMQIIRDEMTSDQKMVLYDYMNNVPQSETAKKMNTSQGQVSKVLKGAVCELVCKMRQRDLL